MSSSHLYYSLPSKPPRWLAWLDVGLVFAVFLAQAAWAAPDSNEPHYLGKAKHFWNPEWCAGDVFLDSHDAHLVFYLSAGWLTLLMPLPAVAWVGRLATWMLLAMAWRRLSMAVVPRPGWAPLSAALFVMLNERCQLAGEWVVGGFESKGLSYVGVLLAIDCVLRNRWNWAWVWLGVASAFHVLVGGWCSIALGLAWLLLPGDRPRWQSMLPFAGLGFVLALPGIWPAAALSRLATSEMTSQANEVYVLWRLRHHLWPDAFPTMYLLRFSGLIFTWAMLARRGTRTARMRRLQSLVSGALAITATGMAIGLVARFFPTWGAGWLRFYWFRLTDALVPLGMALSAVNWCYACRRRAEPGQRVLWIVLLVLAVGHLGDVTVRRLLDSRPRGDRAPKVVNYADWRQACEWARGHTPRDAQFLTPRLAQTFKWYAQRGEVGSWKDIPQDARAIVEWWRRMRAVHGVDPADPGMFWHDSLSEVGVPRIQGLAKTYHADYLLTESARLLALPIVYQNNSYVIYQLPK